MSTSRRGPNKTISIHESDVTAVGSGVIVEGIDMGRPHCFLGVQFFDSEDADTPAVPTTGTISIKIKTYNSNVWELFAEGNFSAANPATISWAANTIAVWITPSSIDVATHYKAIVTCNEP
jgi:hypothetical protein